MTAYLVLISIRHLKLSEQGHGSLNKLLNVRGRAQKIYNSDIKKVYTICIGYILLRYTDIYRIIPYLYHILTYFLIG